MKMTIIGAVALLTSVLSSCSLVENTRRSLLGDSSSSSSSTAARPHRTSLSQSGGSSETVPREQYEMLQARYEALKAKHPEDASLDAASGGPVDPTVELSHGGSEAQDQLASMMTVSESPQGQASAGGSGDYEELRKGILAFEVKKYDLAMNYFDKLTNSPEDQVRYRSRFYAARILYIKKEFSLALQVFEDLIERFAFSGLTIDSLQFAQDCAARLGQIEKVKKYQALSKRLGVEAT